MKKYFVKTRNWHCKQWVFRLLAVSHAWGAVRGDWYDDGDGKFCYETDSLTKALLVYVYYKALQPWSGGWTYIQNTEKWPHLYATKSFYL